MVGAATRGAVGWVATLVRVLGLLIAAILVIHILHIVFVVDPVNAFAAFVRDGANTFSLGLAGLFTPPNQKLAVGVGARRESDPDPAAACVRAAHGLVGLHI